VEVRVWSRKDETDAVSTRTGVGGFWSLELPPNSVPVQGRRYLARAIDGGSSAIGGDVSFMAVPGAPIRVLVIQLRRAMEVRGRVVTEAGAPVPHGRARVRLDYPPSRGGWIGYEGETVDMDLSADAEGVVSVRARAAPEVIAAALATDGTVGRRVFRQVEPDAAVVDVGDVPVPDKDVAAWEIRVTDAAGTAVPHPVSRAGPAGRWELEQCVPIDYERGGHVGPADGIVRLKFARRPDIVFVAIGSPTHLSRTVALDCRTAGEFRATLTLEARPEATVRLKGPATAGLLASGARVLVWGHGAAPRESLTPSEALDLLSGVQVEIPRSALLAPQSMMESELRRQPATPDGDCVVVRGWAAGPHDLELVLGGASIARKSIRLEHGQRGEVHDWEIPDGRVVRLDWSAARAAMFARGGVSWFGRFSAWSTPVSTTSETDPSVAVAMPEHEVLMLDQGSARQVDLPTLWIPRGSEGISFGFVEYARGPGAAAPFVEGTVALGPAIGTDVIEVPVPRDAIARASRVRIDLEFDGQPFRHADIPLEVFRVSNSPSDFLRGRTTVNTDATGGVDVLLFQGEYVVQMAPHIADVPMPATSRAERSGLLASFSVAGQSSDQRVVLRVRFGGTR
jgi:hypothetical protein